MGGQGSQPRSYGPLEGSAVWDTASEWGEGFNRRKSPCVAKIANCPEPWAGKGSETASYSTRRARASDALTASGHPASRSLAAGQDIGSCRTTHVTFRVSLCTVRAAQECNVLGVPAAVVPEYERATEQ